MTEREGEMRGCSNMLRLCVLSRAIASWNRRHALELTGGKAIPSVTETVLNVSVSLLEGL